MRKTKIFAGLLAASLASAALYAAPALTADGVTKAEVLAKSHERFAKMDVNGDGTLDQADRVAKVKDRFGKMDADRNGVITEPEFIAAHEARMEKREDRREMRGDRKARGDHKGHRGGRGGMNMLAKADANGDKAVTSTEFRAAAETRFSKIDANNDGSISAEERKAHRADKRGGKRGNRAVAPTDAS